MKQYERLRTKVIFIRQEMQMLTEKVKRLKEKRVRINRERQIIVKILSEMQRLPLKVFLDEYTEEEIDALIEEGINAQDKV